VVIWTFVSILDGHDRLIEPYVLLSPPRVKIEPSLARRHAIVYLDHLLSCSHPFDLPELPAKNRCGGVVAYTAYLAGTLGRGIMDESRDVLVGLLMEHM